jgi:hypothetical protein
MLTDNISESRYTPSAFTLLELISDDQFFSAHFRIKLATVSKL